MSAPIRISPSSLREGRWYEYVVRFALGGAATVFTGLVSSRYGASVDGLFLAFPAILCASATLIEKHEIRRKRKAGLVGERRGEEAAALDAAGAARGAGNAGLRRSVLVADRTRCRRRVRGGIAELALRFGGGLGRQAQVALRSSPCTQQRHRDVAEPLKVDRRRP